MLTNCEDFGEDFVKNWAFDVKTLLPKLGFLEIRYKQEIDRTIFGNFETYDQTKQKIYANIENL